MRQIHLVARYGYRFLVDRKYRNRVMSLIDRAGQATSGASQDELPGPRGLPPWLRGQRLFVAAGCDQGFLVDYLQSLGIECYHSFASGRGTDPMTELMMPGSKALSEEWDYYLLSVAQVFRGLCRRMQIDGMKYAREQQHQDLDMVVDNYRRAITAIRETSPAPIFLFSYLVSYLPTYGLHEYRSLKDGLSLVEFLHTYHLRLYQLARDFPAVYILDADRALEWSGKASGIDATQSNGIFDHPTREGARRIGDHLLLQMSVLHAKSRRIKCAVFDLDGTLWAGILREDGPAGVAVQEYYLNVMEMLAARGILLAVCSKNDDVEAAHLPGLLGEELHAQIVSRHLSWKPKSQVLRDIAEELNIGLDALAFFDDSPFERGEVAANAPEVLVLTPEQIFGCLNMAEFQQRGELSEEALNRTASYQQQARRKDAEKASGGGLEDFLHGCAFQLDLKPPAPGEISRVFELLQRTNQLNATLTRTSLDQLVKQQEHPESYVMKIARLKDRFGDYGLIGYASARKGPDEWQILDFAFSCRSAGRGVERAILAHLSHLAKAEGVSSLVIDFRPGPRNQQMLEILKECGFIVPEGVGLVEGDSIRLVRPLAAGTLIAPAWLQVA